jgi:two-component system sensor histidine kinase/response regulator
MKNTSDYSLTLKLLLVPIVATLSFAGYLIYSSLVLSGGNFLLREIRDTDFPKLDLARKNYTSSELILEELNTAAATREIKFLNIAKSKASEILTRYDKLEQLDAEHKNEIKKLKSGFKTFFDLAFNMANQMANGSDTPGMEAISTMRAARDSYLSDATTYRDLAEKRFHTTVSTTIIRSERAQAWGVAIGSLMLIIIAALTLRVTRGILSLEKGVAERNAMLARVNNDLENEIIKLKAAEDAKSHAEAASQTKNEFLANMSHELRTPMNAVIGLSHLCLQTEMSRKQQDYLKKIHDSATSLLGILNDILDISKIEAGKMEIDKTTFDLEDVMGNLATIVGNRAQEKNLELLLETALDVPSLLIGDPMRLGQVLINLAGNAVKFTEKGEVVVRTELAHEAGDQVILRFTVADTGMGMSQDEINRLFQPFTQADTSITRKFGGTGLGLTISKRIVEMMGGKIRVESTKGEGSKFSFTARFQIAKNQPSLRRSEINNMRGLRVLAVDDNESSLHILESYLESFSFDVSVVSNGLDALEAVRRANDEGRPFRLAILDWKMPQMDGLELARQLRAMTDLRVKPKLLMISAYGQSEMSLHMDDQIVDGILAKPFQQSKLFDAISRLSSPSYSATGKFRIPAQFNPQLVSQIRGARLLLVEDNDINQQVARELLESFGITVELAENGEEAIERLNKEPFDGVLMDMQMPVMDGVTATREIRKNPQFARLPIIALTANVMVREQKEFIDAGMNDHIGKPIDPDRLVGTLAKWIHPLRAEDNPAPPIPPSLPPLPDLPGVNVAQSVRRIGGKVGIYYSLLEKFQVNNREDANKIREALLANDPQTAERLAHTLRGIAGTIGAETLQSQAAMLESSIKNGTSSEFEPQIAQVEQELATLIISINQALAARES